ncbi:hypothetical protein B6V75_18285 [Thioclava sp. F1Mire-8]|nr:hypothetical protein B6V75_18285 [Thioclava sp. F1Mire-8]
MSAVEEAQAMREIRYYMSGLHVDRNEIDVVLLPELSVPVGFENRLKKIAEQLQTIIIAGFDYRIVPGATVPTVSNDALVIVPRKLNGKKILKATATKRVGKTHPAPAEKRKLEKIASAGPNGVMFQPHPTVWIFDSVEFGKFGVAVCYDFLDLDRMAMYRTKIQTLFILALNKDTNSFDHIAEAAARMVFCNVIVCNCGHFGGSFAVAPFKKAFERTLYRNMGARLANAQIVALPLLDIESAQNGKITNKEFKSLPPGY